MQEVREPAGENRDALSKTLASRGVANCREGLRQWSKLAAGLSHQVTRNGQDEDGSEVPPGTQFSRLSATGTR